ncbi:MAG: helix-turn-helix domain-containing protein [Candidatus Cloacimonadota bacterium]|nr:helix-turn-helix domain-containing protein [Candidatus Cloacimonadota bacterium]
MAKQSIAQVTLRYSEAFKLKVVQEIDKGRLTIAEATRLYEINGRTTIYKWLRKYGKDQVIRRYVRIEMKDEKSILKEKEERIKELESALASVTLHNICLQSYVEVVNENISDAEKKLHFPGCPPSKEERWSGFCQSVHERHLQESQQEQVLVL